MWEECFNLNLNDDFALRFLKLDLKKEEDENMTRGTKLDATILFIIINNSTCFGQLYAHLQEYIG